MARLVIRRLQMVRRRAGEFVLLAAAVFAAALAGGCSRPDGPPNLVLITVDTLRPDRLGVYGHDRPTSPAIDALAAEGVVFTRAYSQAGWTLPAVATILTGAYPKDHGATDFHWSLDAGLRSLASILRQRGYDTRGFISHVILTPTYGMGGGFKEFDYSVLDVGHPHDVATARPLTDLAIRALRDMKGPYFLWVHYFDPHFAYLSHPAFASFGGADIDRYDGEIGHTDFHIARLIEHVGKDAVVVFTADHGEEFGEHSGLYHYTCYDEVMRVPLVIRAPGLAPGTDDSIAEQIDLLPTMLGLLGIEPAADLPGRDLLSGAPDDTPMFIERDRPPPWRQRGVIRGNHKLFVVELQDSTEIPPASRGTEVPVTNVETGIFMYDLAADPGERSNIFSPNDPVALELLGLVTAHFTDSVHRTDPVELDEALVKKLRSLGYLR